MAFDLPAWFASFTNWLGRKGPLAFLAAVAIALIMWGPAAVRNELGIASWVRNCPGCFGLPFAIALLAWLSAAYSVVKGWCAKGRKVHQRRKRLHDLRPGEKIILQNYFYGDTHAQTLNLANGEVKGLEHYGIIYQASDLARPVPGGAVVDYNIQPWAWDYLKKHPELLD